jgi:hypothetical protein
MRRRWARTPASPHRPHIQQLITRGTVGMDWAGRQLALPTAARTPVAAPPGTARRPAKLGKNFRRLRPLPPRTAGTRVGAVGLCLGSAKPIACDAAGRLDTAAANRTIGAEDGGAKRGRDASPFGWMDLRSAVPRRRVGARAAAKAERAARGGAALDDEAVCPNRPGSRPPGRQHPGGADYRRIADLVRDRRPSGPLP